MSCKKAIAELIFNNWLQSMEDRGIMPKGTTAEFKIIVEEEELELEYTSPSLTPKERFDNIVNEYNS